MASSKIIGIPLYKKIYSIIFIAAIFFGMVNLKDLIEQFFSYYDFKILNSEVVYLLPAPSTKNIIEYVVVDSDGITKNIRNEIRLLPSEQLLPGVTIKKNKYSFSYLVNGQNQSWSYLSIRLFEVFICLMVFLYLWYVGFIMEYFKIISEKIK